MKKATSLLLGASILVAIGAPTFASAKFVKASKDLGVAEIKNCNSCHTSRRPSNEDLNEIGQWLVEQKKARQAKECDMSWLRDYFASKN